MNNTSAEVTKFIQTHSAHENIWHSPEEISPDLLVLSEIVAELTSSWNPVEIYTPSAESIEKEKSKFFEAFDSSKIYQPDFQYKTALGMDFDVERQWLEAVLNQVRKIKPLTDQDRLFRVALRAKVLDDLATCDLVGGIQKRDEELIAAAMRQKYPTGEDYLVDYAIEEVGSLISGVKELADDSIEPLLTTEQQELLKNTKFNAQQIKNAFEWALQQYGLLRTEDNPNGYEVEISDGATGIDVRDKSKKPMTIYIPINRVVTGIKLCELMAHEIEGHARQSMNGYEIFGLGGGPLKMDGEVLYEGLAKRYDDSFHLRFLGKTTGTPTPWYALAANRANKGASFYDIFSEQFNYRMHVLLKTPLGTEFDINAIEHVEQINKAKEQAWVTTYRVMRGHVDMTNPYSFGMNKDLSYLRGWLMDRELRESGYGGINEMAIIQSGGLQMLGRLGISEEDIPHPYRDIVSQYLFEELLPQLESSPNLKDESSL